MDILVELEPAASAQAGVDRDHDLLGAVHDGERAPCLRLWINPPCLVVTRRDARNPAFEAMSAQFAGEGWPIAVRMTGGGAVTHGPDGLNVSLIQSEPREASFCPDRHYEALAQKLTPALSSLGIEARLAPVAQAYCPGDHDLQADGKKIAGLAQRVRTGKAADGGTKRTVLSHLSLLVETDVAAMTARINRFYDGIGSPRAYRGEVCASLSSLTGQPIDAVTLASAIAQASQEN